MPQANKTRNGSLSISQVTFLSISNIFPLDQDVHIQYRLSGKWRPTPSDWIGLFRSNEDDVNKYVTYEWSRSPKRNLENETVTLEVTFQAKTLPQDGALYQFFYVTKQGNVRGRSVPFTIGKEKAASSEPEESDSEFVVVENSFENFEKAQAEMEEIKKENCALLKRVRESEAEAGTSKDMLALAEKHINEMKVALQSHQDTQVALKKEEVELAELQCRLTQETIDKEKFKQDLAELRRHHEEQLASFKDQIERMGQENGKSLASHSSNKNVEWKLADIERSLQEQHEEDHRAKNALIAQKNREIDKCRRELVSRAETLEKRLSEAEELNRELQDENEYLRSAIERFGQLLPSNATTAAGGHRLFEDRSIDEFIQSSNSSINSSGQERPSDQKPATLPNAIDRFVRSIFK